jgi:RNA polymerase sigma factor (sigma-70 family)
MDQLVDRARAQDKGAMGELLQMCERQIRSAINLRVARAGSFTEELFLESWSSVGEKIVTGFGTFDGRSKPCTWMVTVANNATIDVLRKHNRTRKGLVDAPLGDEAHSASFEESSVDERTVSVLLRELNDADSELLSLRYFERLTFREIADGLGVSSEDTVRDRVKSAEKRARAVLGSLEG